MTPFDDESRLLKKHIMIVAGEASGDLHGANLIRALHRKAPEITVSGMGGPLLADAGVDILFNAAKIAVVGVIEVLSHLMDIGKARQILHKEMVQKKPALLILIDFPDFNMLLAKQAQALGIPVLYYISPQIWAWRAKRVHKIARLTNRVATILPFEQKFYRQYGYQVDYVGHPLLDTVVPGASREQFVAAMDIPQENLLIGLFPGSRTKEVAALLPPFLEAASVLQQQIKVPLTFLLVLAPTISREVLDKNGLPNISDQLDIRITATDRYTVMTACDAAMAASGTVTLELAISKTPTVVCYRLSPITYIVGKLLIYHLRFFSLVNLIAEQEVFPELLQNQVTADAIASSLLPILQDHASYQYIVDQCTLIREKLGSTGASERTADIAWELIRDG
ncbi:MAG: lipid-A-disaccharide synthase [Desulfobulbus propionicus]|nr:MAG: lipid-A-disaccharide synthase [Desulfobulbus propionicus]